MTAISFKTYFLAATFFIISVYALGQATLPFSYDGGRPVTTLIGLTYSGLGTDYAASPKIKFDTTGDYLILNFTGVPGILSFNIEWNQGTTLPRFPGTFSVQESSDGITYSTVQFYNATNGTALINATTVTESLTTLLPTSRYIKWVYTSKSNGNIGIGAINLTAGVNPVLTVSTNTLNGFGYLTGNGPSSEQSMQLSGSALYNNIIVTPPNDYEISKGSGALFVATKPITLNQTSGIVSGTNIYARLKSGLAVGNYNENISVTTAAANSISVTCNGTVIANPTITLTDITDPILNTIQGNPVTQTLNVSGVNLSAGLVLAISGVDASLFSLSQYTVNQTGGTVPNTVVTITYSPGTAGSNTAVLTMSSPVAMPVIRTLNGVASIATEIISPKTSLIVTVENGNVLFMANEGETVEIYNSIGQKLIQKLTVDGMNTIHVSSHGVIMVKVGNRVTKVIM